MNTHWKILKNNLCTRLHLLNKNTVKTNSINNNMMLKIFVLFTDFYIYWCNVSVEVNFILKKTPKKTNKTAGLKKVLK